MEQNKGIVSKDEIAAIVAKMSLEEKCSLFSGKNFWETVDYDKYGIPSIFLADGPHGIRKQAKAADHLGLNESIKATCFPTSATTANSFDTDLGQEIGEALGKEAVYQKVNVLLGPGLNIKRNPLCGRNFEYYSEDPILAGRMAASYVKGIQSTGIAACLKHYAANNQEHRRMLVDTIVDERTLREIYLTNFEIGVKEGQAKTIMAAYNRLNGPYTNEDPYILRTALRDDWGFKGVIVSDWGGQNDRVEAIRCGAELEMPSSGGVTSREVMAAVESGKLDVSYVDECATRFLELVFDTESVYAGKAASDFKPFDIEAHHSLAMRAAEESIVLLENKNDALPLKAKEKVAIVGDFAKVSRYQGAGSSGVNPTKVDNTLDIVKNYGDSIEYVGFAPGFKRFGGSNKGMIKKALILAQKADTVIVYLGLDEFIETEGLDRKNMRLNANQVELLRALKVTGKKIVAVLSCGAALEIDFSEYCDALVHAYLFGQAGASAVLNVLTGKVNPSGKLAETYPIRYTDCPSATNFPASFHGDEKESKNVEYREGIFVGYRYYDTANVKVQYPFGYGLSYTTFEYSNLKVTKDGVSFDVKNTGSVKGKEVCQLYIGMESSKIFRAKKELKGFSKVELSPGETKTVNIGFDEYSFRYYNINTSKWEVEGGKYNVFVSSSSLDCCIKLTGSIEQKATTDNLPYQGLELPSYASGQVDNVSLEEFTALYGKEVPDNKYPFIEGKKKKRFVVDLNTGLSEMVYAKGWLGRFFAKSLRRVYKLLNFIGMKKMANMLTLNLFNMPIRGFNRFQGMTNEQLDGLIKAFNGKTGFFRIGLFSLIFPFIGLWLTVSGRVNLGGGLGQFFSEGRKNKKIRKAQKKAGLTMQHARVTSDKNNGGKA